MTFLVVDFLVLNYIKNIKLNEEKSLREKMYN